MRWPVLGSHTATRPSSFAVTSEPSGAKAKCRTEPDLAGFPPAQLLTSDGVEHDRLTVLAAHCQHPPVGAERERPYRTPDGRAVFGVGFAQPLQLLLRHSKHCFNRGSGKRLGLVLLPLDDG